MKRHYDESNCKDAMDTKTTTSPTGSASKARKMVRKKFNFESTLHGGYVDGNFRVRRIFRRQNVMSLDLDTIQNLKNALFKCIMDALSENTEIRRVAEEKILAMEIIEEFAIHLCDFAQNKNMCFAHRQMSSVLLKQYVDAHWSTTEENHVLQNFVLRNRIRKQLLEGLSEPNSKIRNAFSYCVSYVGSLDYPSKWITLFNELHDISANDPKYAIFGVLRVYEDLIKDTDPTKVHMFAEPLLKELCYIFEGNGGFSLQVRTTTIHVLCLYVHACGSSNQNTMRAALTFKLFSLSEYFLTLLEPEEYSYLDYAMKTNIIRFFTLLVQKFDSDFGPNLVLIMPSIWNTIMRFGDLYAKYVINSDVGWVDADESEGKVVGCTPLVLSLFDFIHCIIDSPNLNPVLYNALTDLFNYIIIFMRISKPMEEAWSTDPMTFIDGEQSFDTIIRYTARDVLTMICQDFEDPVVMYHFSTAICRQISSLTFVPAEWKVHESIMFAMGSMRDSIIRGSENILFNFHDLTNTWLFALNHPELPFFLGRALWFSGKFSRLLPTAQFNAYMKSTLIYLKHDNVILKLFALRSVVGHSEDFSHNINKYAIANHVPTIVESLLQNLSVAQPITYVHNISLNTLSTILSLGTTFAESMEPRISPLIINIFMKYHADPEIMNEVRQIVKQYCLHTQVSMPVREKFTPILANILNSNDEKMPCSLKTVAMDLLQTLVKCSKPPLSDTLLIGFPAAINCILHSDDQVVMSSGGECLRSYILIGVEQICSYRDPEGVSGLEYVLRAITQLLDPSHSEEACKRIGRLIINLITKAGSVMGSHMNFLLRSILCKMYRVEQMDVWQSLLLVFVYLFYTESEFVVNFLTSVPGITGVSALEFVLVEWLNREAYFVGSYDRTVSVIALTKLLEYSVTTDETRFDSIMVRDEYIPATLSPRKEPMWTQIPVLGKAFKIICNESHYHANKNRPPLSGTDEDSDSDETISHVSDFRYYDTDADQQDVLYAQDPIFSINILAHLQDFILKFKNIPRFQWYVNYLNCREKNTLAAFGAF